MKNLEIKIRLKNASPTLLPFYREILHQKDTYFSCPDGRLKIREEKGKEPYAIFYNRPDEKDQKLSHYEFYPIKDMSKFMGVFGSVLHQEIIVEKTRELYIIENARVHIDTVKNLGKFLEIEVVMSDEEKHTLENSNRLLNTILSMTGNNNSEKIAVGYRELLMRKLQEKKDVEYYTENPQLFWVVNKNIPDRMWGNGRVLFKANEIVPAIFTEYRDGKHFVLQLDLSIKTNNPERKYTMWRRLVGHHYGIHVSVLLIDDYGFLNDLEGNQVSEIDIGKSDIYVNRKFLAYFSE